MIEARYRLKFYINAYHFIRWQGHDGAVHPHTWEIVSDFSCLTDEEVPFTDYEKKIGTFLAQYDGQVLNDVPPFDQINPTVENFATEIFQRLRVHPELIGAHVMLEKLEVSGGPTRSYILMNID